MFKMWMVLSRQGNWQTGKPAVRQAGKQTHWQAGETGICFCYQYAGILSSKKFPPKTPSRFLKRGKFL